MPDVIAEKIPWQTNPPELDLNGPRHVAFQPFQAAWIERPAVALFGEVAARHPQRIACEDVDSSFSFSEVWAGARRLAATIDTAVPHNAAVGILLPNQASYPVAVLACLAAARPAVLIDRHFPQERVAAIMRDAGCAGMVMAAADIANGYLLPAGLRPFALEDALTGEAPAAMPAGSPPPDAASFVVYTSGSTGRPKGIVLSQRAVLHRAAELVNAVHLHADDKVLSLASPSTIGGLQQIFEVMLSGASLVKLDLQQVGLGEVVRIVAERRITMMFSTPAVWRSVSGLGGAAEKLASLRCIQSSGDMLLRIDHDQIRAVLPRDCHVLSVYGATEAPALLQWFVVSPPDEEARVPAGYPLPDIDLALLDEAGRPVPEGEPGELVVRSRFTSLGLWQRGAVVPGVLEKDPNFAELKRYRTGDLARRRPDGLYVVIGRRDRQIKILGNRVQLAEVETALRQAPGVLDAAAVAQRGEGEPIIVGFVVPRGEGDPGLLETVRRHLQTTLPGYMRPRQLLVLDRLPLLPGRKIDENALLLAQAASIGDPRADRTPDVGDRRPSRRAVDMVDKAWRIALGRAPPRSKASFEEAGGNSLQLLQLIFELERLAERVLPMERFHGRLTVHDIAHQIDLDEPASPLTDDVPTIFLFPPVGIDAYLTQFRAACAARVEVRQVRYPELRTLAGPRMSFETIATETARQIDALKPAGRLILAGYSDGGDMAYAAARHLLARGRDVGRLLILDTDASGMSYAVSAAAERPRRGPRLPGYLRHPTIRHYRRLVELLVPGRLLRTAPGRVLLRFVLAFHLPVPASIAFITSLKAYMVVFDEHHCRWSIETSFAPMDVPIVLFRSQERRQGTPEDLGWRKRTTGLTIVPVAGDHSTMLGGNNGIALAEEFARLASKI